ncbi:MAG: TlpA disulfide reductase family protein [Pseudomonadota bacterium]
MDILKFGSRFQSAILLLLAMTVVAGVPSASGGLSGATAPEFALRNAAGEQVALSDLRGEVVMINFWATWCGPCRQEMPLLDELHSRYNRVGFSLLGVNIDDDQKRAYDGSNDSHGCL